MEEYYEVLEQGTGELFEKKSRFLAIIISVHSEEEALTYIASRKKEFWDARHNCYAYIIGSQQEITRYSDDGEPSMSAGRPILEVMLAKHLTNSLVIVMRYFGGTLLGVGGLVRAYQGATLDALCHATLIRREIGSRYQINCQYDEYGKLEYLFQENQIVIQEILYEEKVRMMIILNQEEKEQILKLITEKTNGKASVEKLDIVAFGRSGKKIIFF